MYFSGGSVNKKWPPWPIPPKGGILYSDAQYVTLWASCLHHSIILCVACKALRHMGISLSVVCHTFLVVKHSYVFQATHAFLRICCHNPLFSPRPLLFFFACQNFRKVGPPLTKIPGSAPEQRWHILLMCTICGPLGSLLRFNLKVMSKCRVHGEYFAKMLCLC